MQLIVERVHDFHVLGCPRSKLPIQLPLNVTRMNTTVQELELEKHRRDSLGVAAAKS